MLTLAGRTSVRTLWQESNQWSAPLGSPSGVWMSDDYVYRYLLWRTFQSAGQTPPLVFGMLNPSRADADIPDPTMTRCLGFAEREGAGGIIIVNVSPYRATDPKDLRAAHARGVDVLQRDANAKAIAAALAFSPSIVLGWGAGIRPFLDEGARLLRVLAAPALCLGKTDAGEPRHPLMLRADTPLVAYP